MTPLVRVCAWSVLVVGGLALLIAAGRDVRILARGPLPDPPAPTMQRREELGGWWRELFSDQPVWIIVKPDGKLFAKWGRCKIERAGRFAYALDGDVLVLDGKWRLVRGAPAAEENRELDRLLIRAF